MALQGCCCCGLRGGAKAIGVFFLVITLLQLIGVIVAWVVMTAWPKNVAAVGVDTPKGRFGVQLTETSSLLGGSNDNLKVDLGPFGGSVSSDGHFSLRTPQRRYYAGSSGDTWTDSQLPWSHETILIPNTVFALLALLFNSMLIHGTNNDSSCAVLAWLVFYGAMFVLFALATLGSLIACAVLATGRVTAPLAIVCGVTGGIGLLVIALVWFWWAVVLEFYRQLRDGTAGYKYQLQESPHLPPASRQAAEACA